RLAPLNCRIRLRKEGLAAGAEDLDVIRDINRVLFAVLVARDIELDPHHITRAVSHYFQGSLIILRAIEAEIADGQFLSGFYRMAAHGESRFACCLLLRLVVDSLEADFVCPGRGNRRDQELAADPGFPLLVFLTKGGGDHL